ncbi:Aste57867_24318 [Aphanomyces stellatus]|uniref:Aste57867_24318 protein n=1 Tax=Aphanomyces stellatus TaxID=120398 RepID=A0A485LUG8_9STRA|nr:hypothetical protein As57867_024243 [Aphanomyces stellatus]VFU00958.1 Aste57867_24318 [Aphanomyces stellatus]
METQFRDYENTVKTNDQVALACFDLVAGVLEQNIVDLKERSIELEEETKNTKSLNTLLKKENDNLRVRFSQHPEPTLIEEVLNERVDDSITIFMCWNVEKLIGIQILPLYDGGEISEISVNDETHKCCGPNKGMEALRYVWRVLASSCSKKSMDDVEGGVSIWSTAHLCSGFARVVPHVEPGVYYAGKGSKYHVKWIGIGQKGYTNKISPFNPDDEGKINDFKQKVKVGLVDDILAKVDGDASYVFSKIMSSRGPCP